LFNFEAIKNALRYFPEKHHEQLGKEFLEELKEYGHIYMYRFRPTSYEMKVRTILIDRHIMLNIILARASKLHQSCI
jgi:hypothetical protein